MGCCGSTNIIQLTGGGTFSFDVTSGNSPTTVLSGPQTVTDGDFIHFWSAGGINFNVTPGSAVVNIEPANITDALATAGAPASPPADVIRPAIHFASDGIWVWDTVGLAWAFSAPSASSTLNFYNVDGIQTDALRTYNMDGNDLAFLGGSLLTLDAGINFTQYPETRDDTSSNTPINFLYTSPSGDLQSAPLTALPSGTNIYNADGSLNSTRILDGNGNPLTFQNVDGFTVQGLGANNIILDAGLGGDIQLLGTIITHGNYTAILFDNHPPTRDDTSTFAPQNFWYSGPSGELYSAPLSALPSGTNIYNADGILTGARTLDTNGFALNFTGTGPVTINPNNDILLSAPQIFLQSGAVTARVHFIDGYFFDGGNIRANQYPNTRDDTGILTPSNFLYTDGAGSVLSAPLSSLPSGTNIYNADGVLTGNRRVDGATNSLNFDNLSFFRVGQNTDVDNVFLAAGQPASTGGSLSLSNTAQVTLASYGTNITLFASGISYVFNGPDAFWISYPSTRDDTPSFTPANFLYTDAGGAILSAPLSSLPSGTNIYNADGTLTSNRILDGGGNNLTMQNISTLTFNAPNVVIGDVFAGNVEVFADIRLADYAGVRNDTSTFAPQNFLYNGTLNGDLLSAPLAVLISQSVGVPSTSPNIASSIAYDAAAGNIYGWDGAAWQTLGGSANTLYTADDTLTGNRTVDGNGNDLNFLNMDGFNVDGTGSMALVGDGNVTLQSDAGAAFISGQTQANISSAGPVNITATGTGPINLSTANLQPINIQAAPGGDINLGSQPGLFANQVKIRAVGAPSDYDVVIGDSVQHLATDVSTGLLQQSAGNVHTLGHHSGTQNLRVDVAGLTDFMWFEIRATANFNVGSGGGSAIYRAHYNPTTGAVAIEESAASGGGISLAFAGASPGSLAFTVTPVPAGTDARKTLELHMYGTELPNESDITFSAV